MVGLLYTFGALGVLFGCIYILAALGVEALDNLTESAAGGPWVQGIIALGLGLALIVAGNRKRQEGGDQE